MIALHLLGYDLGHPVMRAGLESLDRFTLTREDGSRMVEACQSPVWDTCLATIALADAGVPADHPQLIRAADWMLDEQIERPGDWSVRRPHLAPGGWAFEFHNDNYPDIDDTAEVVLALRRVRHPDTARMERAISLGVRWNLGMQSKNGAWGAFDVDNTSSLPNRLPFCDFGEVVDPPSADVTAHVVEMLAAEGLAADPRTRRAVDWLLAEQEPSGAWFGRWGVNYLYGTGSAVPALIDAGLPTTHPAIRRAVAWLESVQNDDGGWGEDLRSYREQGRMARGASTASQTGWALMALLAAGERESRAARRGVTFLADTQHEDGSWDEPYYTGTGFPGTSPSTTTCTGRSSRSRHWAGTPAEQHPRMPDDAPRNRRAPAGPGGRPGAPGHRLRPHRRTARPAHRHPRPRGHPDPGAPYRHGARGGRPGRRRGAARPGAGPGRGGRHRVLRGPRRGHAPR